MTTKDKVLERLKLTVPRLGSYLAPERRMEELGADSIDLVELFVVIDSDFGVRVTTEEFSTLTTIDDLLELIVQRTKKTI